MGSDRKEGLHLCFVTLLDPAACADPGLQWSPGPCTGSSWEGEFLLLGGLGFSLVTLGKSLHLCNGDNHVSCQRIAQLGPLKP